MSIYFKVTIISAIITFVLLTISKTIFSSIADTDKVAFHFRLSASKLGKKKALVSGLLILISYLTVAVCVISLIIGIIKL